jgi:RNA polymerase sigma-70 factor (ECF subfamily)
MSPRTLTDHELWSSILQGSHTAFSILFDRYWASVYTTVYSYVKDETVSKEITHDIFLNIWLKRQQLQILSFSAYLRAAGRYHVYKYIKQAKAIPVIYSAELEESADLVCRNQGDENLGYLELKNHIDDYLGELPKRCREVFILSRQQHLTNDQIAGKLGISKRTVENQLTHALHHLRGLLKNISIGIFVWLLIMWMGY